MLITPGTDFSFYYAVFVIDSIISSDDRMINMKGQMIGISFLQTLTA